MNLFVDTSVLVRYLTGRPPETLERARRIIDETQELRITETVLLETAHVLRTVYQLPREAVVDCLIDLIRKRNIAPHNLAKNTVIAALLLCRDSGRVSFGDALIWAAARDSSPAVVYSFDQRFPSDGVTVRAESD